MRGKITTLFNPLELGMSDLANLSRLAPAVSQLPVDWYFDNRFMSWRKSSSSMPARLCRPPVDGAGSGDYRSLEWKDHGQMLLNGGSEGKNAGIWQMSNVCRHRQAIMLQGSGHLNGPIVCPIHRWTYEQGGELIGAPHFPQTLVLT
jgi:hypothetical protein